MKSSNQAIKNYIDSLPEERKNAIESLRKIIKEYIPKGFEETFNYGMISYVVPLSIYPKGYHCSSETPLPFINIASQKSHIAIYHMGIYAQPELLNWFTNEYTKLSKKKLDMGKSCIRFKKVNEIPYDLIKDLVTKMSVTEWIHLYEKSFIKK
jgi:uncharacterized protein YdhG (YjbR/CyaY superfamily)